MRPLTRQCKSRLVLRLLTLGLILVQATGFIHAKDRADDPRPNILIIRADDLGRWALGAYGNKDVVTPNLDLFFRTGVTFNNAFVTTPVCSPSRMAMLTGSHSVQTGIADWIPSSDMATGIRDEFVTWPEVLRGAGYTTAQFGKWHLGFAGEFYPTRHGFDQFIGMRSAGDNFEPFIETNGSREKIHGRWRDDYIAEKVVEFITTPRDRPYAAIVDFHAPHTPYAPVPDEDAVHYRDRKLELPPCEGADRAYVEEQLRAYYASVTYLDRCVGRVLDAVGMLGNTFVLFTSDHGYMIGQHALQHKGNAVKIDPESRRMDRSSPLVRRPNMFDDSIRVPLALRWIDGGFRHETPVDAVVTHLDIFPTVLELAKAPVPALAPSQAIRGASLMKRLWDRGSPGQDAVFGDYDIREGKRSRMRMIRTADWKLVKHYSELDARDELYDLRNDPGELRNLFPTAGAELPAGAPLADLERRLLDWQKSVNDPLLADLARESAAP